jgi:hypothetical protein
MSNFLPVGIGFNSLTFAIAVMALIMVYLLIIALQNMFISFTPRALGRFIMFMFLLGSLWPWIIIGNNTMIYLIGALTVIVLFYFIYKQIRMKKRTAQNQTAVMKGSGK